jgi:hypothetical protein
MTLSSDLDALPFQMIKYGNIRRAGKSGIKPRRDRLVIIIVLACLFALYAVGRWNAKPDAVISGKPWVIDGDTVSISSTRIRLEGIDAPELDQTCVDANGKSWLCGKVATRELKDYIQRAGSDLQTQNLRQVQARSRGMLPPEWFGHQRVDGAARLGLGFGLRQDL